MEGIAAVMSSSAKIVIMYDSKNAQQRDFIANLKDKLEKSMERMQQRIVPLVILEQPTDLPSPPALINPPRSMGRPASPYREPRRKKNVPMANIVLSDTLIDRSLLLILGEREWTVDNLMDSIERGSADDAQHAAQYLAKSRADIQLNLLTRGTQKKVVAADHSIPADALKFVGLYRLIQLIYFMYLG